MPGPKNAKKKRKAQARKQKEKEKEREKERQATERHESGEHEEQRTPPSEELDLPRVSFQSPSPEPDRTTDERYQPLRSQPLRYTSRPTKARTRARADPTPRSARHRRRSLSSPSPCALPPSKWSPSPEHAAAHQPHARAARDAAPPDSSPPLAPPCVEDRGNGPHVRDVAAFLASKLAAPPSRDDALCAEFARPEVRAMLCEVLPAETALIVWYNKSRQTSRVCPACRRLYRLGEMSREPLLDDFALAPAAAHDEKAETEQSHRRLREQQISGICSALCFVLAAYRYPAAIRSTWGRMAEELSDATWDELDAPGPSHDRDHGSDGTGAAAGDALGFSMMLKMTRCHDLGLGQLFGVEDGDSGGDDGGGVREGEYLEE